MRKGVKPTVKETVGSASLPPFEPSLYVKDASPYL